MSACVKSKTANRTICKMEDLIFPGYLALCPWHFLRLIMLAPIYPGIWLWHVLGSLAASTCLPFCTVLLEVSTPRGCGLARVCTCLDAPVQVPGPLHTALAAMVIGYLLLDQISRAAPLVEPLQDLAASGGSLLARVVVSLLDAPDDGSQYSYGLSESTGLCLMWSLLVVLLMVRAIDG